MDVIDQIRKASGIDPRELPGTRLDGEVPVPAAVLNRVIAERLPPNGPIAALVVEPHDDDRFTVHVRLRSGLVPALKAQVRIVAQPELPSSAVLVLRWSLAGALDFVARFALPALKNFATLPPGVRVDGDLVGIDVAEILRAKGMEWVLSFVKDVQLHTRPGVAVLQLRAGV
jgi:hypothetical protein